MYEDDKDEPKQPDEHTQDEQKKSEPDATEEVVEAEVVNVDIPWLKDKTRKELEAEQRTESSLPEESSEGNVPAPIQNQAGQIQLVSADQPPANVMAFPTQEVNLFPGMVAPVLLPGPMLKELVEKGKEQQQFLAFFAIKPGRLSEEEVELGEVKPDDLYDIGVVARVIRLMQLPGGSMSAVVQVIQRCRAERFLQVKPWMMVRIDPLEDLVLPGEEPTLEALARNIRQLLSEVAELFPNLPAQFVELLNQLDEPSSLADFVALQFLREPDAKQSFLQELHLRKRLEEALAVLLKESEMLKLQKDLRSEIESQVDNRQREYLLREQLKLIRKELGEEADEKELDSQTYKEKIEAAGMPKEAKERALNELRRLSVLAPEAAEYNTIRTYLDWLCDLPWSRRSEGKINLKKARQILDKDHFGLERIKERIIEFLAVHKLKPDQRGAILCFSGPPGVGKTSLGRSIAKAMGREFYRFSVGGMRDEAEIKGHRRTYVGAMPGKLLQALKRVGTKNPVIMLDEIDKIGKDHRGDPASALLEVLDPAQNDNFQDHYLDLPFDLSEVMFIATANYKDAIPPPLLDRMEVIELSGYIPEEKVEIAKRYLLPRQREAHGLQKENIRISKAAFGRIVREYTREAGVRNLEREVGAICRKVATRVAEAMDEEDKVVRAMLRDKNIEKYLGPPRYASMAHVRELRPGRALGLAWTPVGGDLLAIEVTSFKGNGNLQLTGKLGDVMSESSRISLSYLKSNARHFGLSMKAFKEWDFHLHVPSGAVPKDGPSAGITITTAFLSLLARENGLPTSPSIAMTGEITLMGDVLPVGGIREKVVAATSEGIETVILPEANKKDLEEVPKHIRDKVSFHFASHYDDVVAVVFGKDLFSPTKES